MLAERANEDNIVYPEDRRSVDNSTVASGQVNDQRLALEATVRAIAASADQCRACVQASWLVASDSESLIPAAGIRLVAAPASITAVPSAVTVNAAPSGASLRPPPVVEIHEDAKKQFVLLGGVRGWVRSVDGPPGPGFQEGVQFAGFQDGNVDAAGPSGPRLAGGFSVPAYPQSPRIVLTLPRGPELLHGIVDAVCRVVVQPPPAERPPVGGDHALLVVVEALDLLHEVVRLLRLVLDDKHVDRLSVDLDFTELEHRESGLEELVGVAAEEVRDLRLGPAPLAGVDRAHREVAVADPEHQEPGPVVLGVRETEDIVDEFPLARLVPELEIPVDALAPAPDQVLDYPSERAVIHHGCLLRHVLAIR